MDAFMNTRLSLLRQNLFAVCAALSGLVAREAFCQLVAPYPPGGVAYAPVFVSPFAYSHSVNGIGFYMAGDLGISVLQNFDSSRFGFPGSFSADPGVRFSLEPGFDFLSTRELTLGGEFETGAIYNRLSSINEPGGATGLRGDYYQVPLLGNLVLKLHPNDLVTPYIGVGAGGVYSRARIQPIDQFGFGTWSDEIDPAVQATVGVRFWLNPFAHIGLGYKYLATLPGGGSDVATHAVLATFELDF